MLNLLWFAEGLSEEKEFNITMNSLPVFDGRWDAVLQNLKTIIRPLQKVP